MKNTAVPTTTMSSIPSNTELVSILEHSLDIGSESHHSAEVLLPETHHSVGTNVGSFLLQLPEQLADHLSRLITKQSGHLIH